MKFVANLRNETIEAFVAQDIQPDAYLLSSHRITPSTLDAATIIRDLNLPLFADNGTKPLIDDTIESFKESARQISLEVKALRKELGHVPRGNEVPDDLRLNASNLANEIIEHVTKISDEIDSEELLKLQLSMSPTDLIAQEDFATACLVGLDLERETTGWSISKFDTRNRRSLRLWKRVAEDPRCRGLRVYAVLSAIDYNTARSAGRIAASEGVANAALGIAGITRDPSSTDFFVMGKASMKLEKPVPRRYVRLAQVLHGIADGYNDIGKSLENFHCLGLGAPPLFPIPAAALSEETMASTDATSPIHDAVRDKVLYDPEKEGDRASIREIVQRIVEGGSWPFLSPFTIDFRNEFGHDPEKARNFWKEQGQPLITEDILKEQNNLTDALALFSEAVKKIRIVALKTWIAHNHWILGRIANAFPDGKGRQDFAFTSIHSWLSQATSLTTTRGLAAALRVLTRKK